MHSVTAKKKTESLKYRHLADRFRALILDGELKPGEQLPTFAQMHRLHGASRPTVERMLLILESENLIERQNGNGIFVAQPRGRRKQGIIGLSGEGFNFSEYSPYWALLMGGAREAAMRAGMQLLIVDSESSQGWDKADGVLVCDWSPQRRHKDIDVPTVSLLTPVEGVCSVMVDDAGGGYAATRHLMELGHQRIAFLHSYIDSLTARDRVAGYRRALEEGGIQPQPSWARCLQGKYYWGTRFTIEARRNMLLWLQEDWHQLGCTALICQNDEAALGAIQAFTDAGMEVPKDISIVGFDGTEYCNLVSPALTSVELPLRDIGALGLELLIRQIEAGTVSEEHKVLPVRLQPRASTAAPGHSRTD